MNDATNDTLSRAVPRWGWIGSAIAVVSLAVVVLAFVAFNGVLTTVVGVAGAIGFGFGMRTAVAAIRRDIEERINADVRRIFAEKPTPREFETVTPDDAPRRMRDDVPLRHDVPGDDIFVLGDGTVQHPSGATRLLLIEHEHRQRGVFAAVGSMLMAVAGWFLHQSLVSANHLGLASLVLWVTTVIVGLGVISVAVFFTLASRARRRRQRLS